VAEARAWATAELSSDDEVVQCIAAVSGSQIVPSALEIDRPAPEAPVELSVLVEGVTVSVDRRSDELARLLGVSARVSPSPPPWWAGLPGATTMKLAVTVSELSGVLSAIREQGAGTGSKPGIRGSAALGLLYVGLGREADPGAVTAFVSKVRTCCEEAGGSAVVLRAPAAVKEAVDVWGTVKALELMRRVKDNFDPTHRLAPGRFVGGI
jgi:glycolate oxidase FAD binding subunit